MAGAAVVSFTLDGATGFKTVGFETVEAGFF